MENIFKTHASKNAKNLADATELAKEIIKQLTAAYANVVHCRTRYNSGNPKTYVGCHPNESCSHNFVSNKDGTVEYESRPLVFYTDNYKDDGKEHPKVVELMEKYPKSKRSNRSEFQVIFSIRDLDDLAVKAPDIVYMLEKDGFALK